MQLGLSSSSLSSSALRFYGYCILCTKSRHPETLCGGEFCDLLVRIFKSCPHPASILNSIQMQAHWCLISGAKYLWVKFPDAFEDISFSGWTKNAFTFIFNSFVPCYIRRCTPSPMHCLIYVSQWLIILLFLRYLRLTSHLNARVSRWPIYIPFVSFCNLHTFLQYDCKPHGLLGAYD